MGAHPVRQEKNLGMEGPSFHVAIKILEVGILGDRFVEGLKSEAF
jgi:hypothetical protein